MNKIDQQNQTASAEWAPTLLAHIVAYGFLNKVFYHPPAEVFINTLATEDLFSDWPLPANEQTQTGLKIIQSFIDTWSAKELDGVRRDYSRLFVGPDRLLAPPWESVYLSREHLLFEKETLAVRKFYNRFNVQAPNLNTEPDDHIALELAFMAHLCTLGLVALEQNDTAGLETSLQAQRDFMAQHLLRWGPQFCQRVITRAETDYFRGVGHLALGCLETTAADLGATTPETAA